MDNKEMIWERNLIVIITFLLSIQLFAQTLSQLFQQALLKENGEGDLKASLKICQKIVNATAADRSLRTKVQLHIGMYWERWGGSEHMTPI